MREKETESERERERERGRERERERFLRYLAIWNKLVHVCEHMIIT